MIANRQSELLFLHGFTQTGMIWRRVTRLLAQANRFHAPDIRGHGSSGNIRPINFAACIEDALAITDNRITLIGYSMGGRIALLTALSAPERIDRLVLISATAGIQNEVERSNRQLQDQALAQRLESELSIKQFATEWGEQPLFFNQSETVRDLAHQERLKNKPVNLAAALRGIGTGVMKPVWDRLHRLDIPTCLVVGERDHKFRSIAQEMQALLPKAELRVISEAGHACCFERPETIITLLD